MIREGWSDRIFDRINKLFLLIVLLVVLYPLVYVLSASISDPVYVNSGEMWLLPKGVTFEGFARVFENRDIWTGYANTIGYTLFGTMLNFAVTIPCAYALSRSDLLGRNALMAVFVFAMFFSGGLIPTYLLVKELGLLNTFWAMLLPNALSVWNLIICRTFFQMSIPRELQESAEMDGCSNTVMLVRIILPLSAPILSVMALFYGIAHWNAFFSALIYLSDRSLFPLQLIMREIIVQNQMTGMMMLSGEDMESLAVQARIADIIKYAVMIVSILPVVVVYPFLQRYFVKGVMIGSIKG